MPVFAILIDDGEHVASAPVSHHVDFDAAIRSTISSAMTFVTEGSSIGVGPRSIECEVQNPVTREARSFCITVETVFHDR